MSFCGTTRTDLTTASNLRAGYTAQGAVLPVTGLPTDAEMNDEGKISDSWLTSALQRLQSGNIIPTAPTLNSTASNPFGRPEAVDPLKTYVEKEDAFKNTLKAEYCWYEQAYKKALENFMDSVVAASQASEPDTGNIDNQLNLLKELNTKLNTLTQVTNRIALLRYQQTRELGDSINQLNQSLTSKRASLQEHAKIFKSESAAADLHKRMVEYTLEKNKANSNLLGLYAVLNLLALGLVIYIARK